MVKLFIKSFITALVDPTPMWQWGHLLDQLQPLRDFMFSHTCQRFLLCYGAATGLGSLLFWLLLQFHPFHLQGPSFFP